ncbi:unnamed protein product [Owenia fusiformis]|uniref:Alpha-1,3-glucosyltransferase n=1 Tax=Owenia fusiformis TaxID=6347 RepID=A0A8S4N6I5_OWEFU|nr:unnamed protein product [Owenia fusiformis]
MDRALLPYLFVLISVIVVVRWSVSLNSYSGAGKAPMYGDYEAQRHWMEITYNLPVSQWYMNGTNNDLQYWGLDYPPLTAYHSWLCGVVANRVNSSWVELLKSHGMESYDHKLFMRYSVLVVDVLIYIPAAIAYVFNEVSADTQVKKLAEASVFLLYPGLILIDYGHFQYNCVSLGFALLAIYFLDKGRDLWGSIMFCFALNYKQMELYHAAPFFFYLLGSAFRSKKENWFFKLVKLGVVVICSFMLCWFPFIFDINQASQVLHRLFPFARGIFEDKVANFWCSISVAVKLKNFLDQQQLVFLCLGTTVVALLPSCLHLLVKPSTRTFKYALVNSSLTFFLFSFQVHEKSILIAALPVCTLLHYHPVTGLWFLHITTFSMLPLLQKDGLLLATIATMLLYHLATTQVYNCGTFLEKPSANGKNNIVLKTFFWLSMLGCAAIWIVSLTLRPPARYPDLWPVIISLYSCGHFLLFLCYFHWKQFTWTIAGNEQSAKNIKRTKQKQKKFN